MVTCFQLFIFAGINYTDFSQAPIPGRMAPHIREDGAHTSPGTFRRTPTHHSPSPLYILLHKIWQVVPLWRMYVSLLGLSALSVNGEREAVSGEWWVEIIVVRDE